MGFIDHIKLKLKEWAEQERARKKIYKETYEEEYKEQLKAKAKKDAKEKLSPNKKSMVTNWGQPYFKDTKMEIGGSNASEFQKSN